MFFEFFFSVKTVKDKKDTGQAHECWAVITKVVFRFKKRDNYVTHFICCGVRMVHAFTCAGMLPVQYKNMTSFAKIGSVGERYIYRGINPLYHSITSHYYCYYYCNLVYRTAGYLECINAAVEKSMVVAVEENKGLSHYADKGEVKTM